MRRKTFKIGYVSPQTGPLAAFAEADNFVISNFLNTVKGGVKVGSATLAGRGRRSRTASRIRTAPPKSPRN